MVPAVDGISNKLLQERSTYVVVGLRKDLKKDVLGFYTSESESASF
jgi:transposase-like protein